MKTKLLALMFLAGSTMFAGTRVFFGFGYAAPAPVAVYAAPAPVYAYDAPWPGPGYTWVSGYSYRVGPRWGWRAGYWSRRHYVRTYWVAPHYYGGRFYAGFWRR